MLILKSFIKALGVPNSTDLRGQTVKLTLILLGEDIRYFIFAEILCSKYMTVLGAHFTIDI